MLNVEGIRYQLTNLTCHLLLVHPFPPGLLLDLLLRNMEDPEPGGHRAQCGI